MYRVLQFGMTPNYGGIEAFIMNLYRNIDRTQLQFDFWVTTEEKISYEDEIKDLGGRIIRQKYYSRKSGIVKHYKELIDYFENSPETIAIHLNKAVIRDIDLLLISKIMKVPVRIIHSHISYNPHGMDKLEKFNQKLLPLFTTDFIACSEEAGKYLFGSTNKHIIIRDGVNIENYLYSEKSRDKIKKIYEISDIDFIVGSVGRFSEQKNTLLLLDIFKMIVDSEKNAKLLLVGDGKLRSQVEEKCVRYGIMDKVILVGEITNAYEYYSAMDVFLFPSLYEGFGMALLEAQINGMHCIAARDGIPDLVNVTKTVKFLPLSSSLAEWRDAVLECKNKERYDNYSLIQAAGFDSKNTADQLQNIYLRREGLL